APPARRGRRRDQGGDADRRSASFLLPRPVREPRRADAHRGLALMQALIFDLDGTLVDTVYAHVFAWQRALDEVGMPIDGWKIHRRIGMSGGLFARAVAREVGRPLDDAEIQAVQRRHGEIFRELLPERRPIPGAVELLAELREREIVHGI